MVSLVLPQVVAVAARWPWASFRSSDVEQGANIPCWLLALAAPPFLMGKESLMVGALAARFADQREWRCYPYSVLRSKSAIPSYLRTEPGSSSIGHRSASLH